MSNEHPAPPEPSGEWVSQRGPGNRGHGVLPGSGREPRVERTWTTGAEVRQVAEFSGDGAPVALVLAGTMLQAWTWDGMLLWRHAQRATGRILHTAESPQGPLALVLSGESRVQLVELRTGRITWSHDEAEQSNLSGTGSSKLAIVDGRLLWVSAPTYSTAVTCREVVSPYEVRHVWTHDFAGAYDAGFGPVLALTDVLGVGRPQLLMSTRTGSDYGDGGEVASERLVLGREDGRLFQLVLDLDSGEVLQQVAYRPDDGEYPCARPYGLLDTAEASEGRVVVMVSCQVEEYLSVTRVSPEGLSRSWGRFVEKDWPQDRQELRPQVTSLVPRPGQDPWLVVGHHDGHTWTTLLLDATTGDQVGQLADHYFWGTSRRGDDVVVVVSPAVRRSLTGAEPLASLRIDDLAHEAKPGLAHTHRGHPVISTADELPPNRSFHAERRSLTPHTREDGRTGLLTAGPEGEVGWWDPHTGDYAPIAAAWARLGHPVREGATVLQSESGVLRRLGSDLSVTGTVQPQGRRPTALVVQRDEDGPAILLDGVNGSTVNDLVRPTYGLPGRVAAAGRGPAGTVAACIEDAEPGSPRVVCWHLGPQGPQRLSEIVTPGVPTHVALFDSAQRVLVSERTGVHTAAIGCYRLDGSPIWRDADRGPHPNLPLAAAGRDGGWRIAYDDHGLLTVRDAGSGAAVAADDWTAAYATPVLLADPEELLLRVGGIHGVDALDGNGIRRWRHSASSLWRYFPGEASIASGPHGEILGCMTRDGTLEGFSTATGELLWSTDIGSVAPRPPLVSLALAPCTPDSFLTGTADGWVVAVDVSNGSMRPWSVRFDCAVSTLAVADVDGDGSSELLVGTADGSVHLVRC